MKAKELVKTLVFVLVLLAIIQFAVGQPRGASLSYNSTETKPDDPAASLNTTGGTFTTIILSGETQNLKWKAYAGNVTGVLTLDDSGDYSIYQWPQTDFTGEVYASRNDSITWTDVACASDLNITNEETIMNHVSADVDSINSTFSLQIHQQFYVGSVDIAQSSCRSAFTWVNDSAQTPAIDAPFQEVLLHDGNNMIYATFIDDNTQGFNYNDYDFQMIVPEQGIGGLPATRYYFYMELQ